MTRRFGLVALLAGLLLLAACGRATSSNPGGSATPASGSSSAGAPSPTVQAVQPRGRVAITLQSQSIEPATLSIPLHVPVELQITNNGDPCLFFLGEDLRGLLVMKGETGEATIIAPSLDSAADRTMGCLGETARKGQVSAAASATPPATAATSAPSGTRQLDVIVRANGLQPPQVSIPYDVPLHLTVNNDSGPCLFYLGDYLRGLLMPENSAADATFLAPGRLPYPRSPVEFGPVNAQPSATPSSLVGRLESSAGPPNVVTMGCVGDTSRQAMVNVPPNPTPTPPTGTPIPGAARVPEAAPTQQQLTISDNHIDPSQVTVPGARPVELHVVNQSHSSCNFEAGTFAGKQTIAAGQSATVSFTVPTGGDVSAPIGCAGDAARQGALLVRFTGVEPGQ